MIEIHYGEGKTFTKIENLHEWESNPKSASEEALSRLKYQITKLGQHTPLLVMEDGTVLGGNQRLKVYKEIGMENVWISIVYPKDSAEKMEFALSSNDHVAVYVQEKIQNAVEDYEDIDWSQYTVQFEELPVMEDLIEEAAEEEKNEPVTKTKKPITCPNCSTSFIPE